MAKIVRKLQKIFGSGAGTTGITSFGSTAQGSTVYTTDLDTIQSTSAFSTGWLGAVLLGTKRKPVLQDRNALDYLFSTQLANIFQDGIPVYNSGTTYYIGSIVRQDATSNIYKSITDNNTGNVLTDTTNWANLGDLTGLGSATVQMGICNTSGSDANKTLNISGFNLHTGVTVLITFANNNIADSPTLNINSSGNIPICNEGGNIVNINNPAYFPIGSTIKFTYNGANWIFENKIINNYINGTNYYEQYSNGKIIQGGIANIVNGYVTVNLLKTMKNTNYSILAIENFGTTIVPSFTSADIVAVDSVTTSSFRILGSTNADTPITAPATWKVSGY